VLDLEPTGFELLHERAEKLVATARGRRNELVKEREIRPAAPRRDPVRLDPSAARKCTTSTASRPRDGAKLHEGDGNVGRSPMRFPCHLERVFLRSRLPLRTRLSLRRAGVRRRIRPKAAYTLRYGPGEVFLSHSDYEVDRKSFRWVVMDDPYRTDYRGAVVLDLGAHKGYYGAHAIARGARVVISFEPDTANIELLEQAAAAYRRRGADWRVRPSAVGAERGEAELHLMAGSWAHSLHPPQTWAQFEVGTRRVPVEAIAHVLEEIGLLGERIIVKVNTEGEECAIVLGAPPDAWSVVSELFVEMHEWVDCSAADLTAHLAPAGFRKAPTPKERVLRLRREADPRSDPRTAPR
jgi:FkbM family methyltransferase